MPFIFNPLSGNFDYYQSSSSTSGGLTVPQQIEGLAFDFDPANGVTKDVSNNVSTVIDQGPYGFTLSQSTGANQPLYVASGANGKPTIRFSKASNQFLTADIFYPGLFGNDSTGTGWTMYAVFKFLGFTTNPDYQGLFTSPTTLPSSQRGQLAISNDAANYADFAFGCSGNNPLEAVKSGSIGLSTTGFHVLKLDYNGNGSQTVTNFTFTYDSTTGTTTNNGGYGSITTGNFTIGATSPTQNPANVEIARFLIFAKTVSPANDAKLRAYFNTQYGTP